MWSEGPAAAASGNTTGRRNVLTRPVPPLTQLTSSPPFLVMYSLSHMIRDVNLKRTVRGRRHAAVKTCRLRRVCTASL